MAGRGQRLANEQAAKRWQQEGCERFELTDNVCALLRHPDEIPPRPMRELHRIYHTLGSHDVRNMADG
jgi:hypothetical protein